MSTVNTGNLITVTLLSVRSDITNSSDPYYQEPMDVNNVPCRISGLAQASKSNVSSDPNYIPPTQNLSECPLPTTSTTTMAPEDQVTSTTTTAAPGFNQNFPITNSTGNSISITNFLINGSALDHSINIANGQTVEVDLNYTGSTTDELQLLIGIGSVSSATLQYTPGTLNASVNGSTPNETVTFNVVNFSASDIYTITLH